MTMTVIGVGLSGVDAHDSGAAEAGHPRDVVAAALPPPTSVTTTTTTPPEPSTTTTTVAPEPPPEPPTTTTTAPVVRVAAAAEPSRQEQIEAIADGTGWNWRAAGVRLTVGFYPGDCCHWGIYDSARETVWIGPSAFGHPERLRYVVLHELGHAWQYNTGRFDELIADYRPWGRSTPTEALEAGGDCIATLWGATDHHYWACPAAALRTAARRLAGDWS
ncbi:MAG: hypothetical protein ACRD0O_00400 [Acidimicrobiia bacterium]